MSLQTGLTHSHAASEPRLSDPHRTARRTGATAEASSLDLRLEDVDDLAAREDLDQLGDALGACLRLDGGLHPSAPCRSSGTVDVRAPW